MRNVSVTRRSVAAAGALTVVSALAACSRVMGDGDESAASPSGNRSSAATAGSAPPGDVTPPRGLEGIPFAAPAPADAPPMTPRDGWRYTFIDRFDKGSLDERHWSAGWFADGRRLSGPVNPKDGALMDSANMSFSEEGMSLRLTREPATLGSVRKNYRGALVSTVDKVQVRPGCVVGARIKVPGEGGVVSGWPAFWLNTNDWPNGEFDIFEGLYGGARWYMHYGSTKKPRQYGGLVPGTFVGWHDFRCHWETDRLDFYFDDLIVGSVTEHISRIPAYIILGIGYDTAAAPPPIPAVMTVSSVYVMRRD